MSDLLNWFLYSNEAAYIFIPLIYGAIAYLIFAIVKQNKNKRKNNQTQNQEPNMPAPEQTPHHQPLPYKRKPFLFTNTEYYFYKSLNNVIGKHTHICPKVGMKDFITVNNGLSYSENMSYFGRIAQKHVDFLICEKETMRPLCCIELDDPSHNREKTIKRDNLVESVYHAANFPLIRFRTQYNYDENEIFYRLQPYIQALQPQPQTTDQNK